MINRTLKIAGKNPETLSHKQEGPPFPSDNREIAGVDNQSGYTLIEVLIALAIFSIGILALVSLQLSTARNTKTGRVVSQATMLARDQMESLRRVADVTTLSSGSETNVDAQGNPGGIFDRSWTISNPLGGGNTRQITVAVSWKHNKENRSVELSTITKH
jgi:prepilin-type N-terminal cleavage/methylation domain-containing protein